MHVKTRLSHSILSNIVVPQQCVRKVFCLFRSSAGRKLFNSRNVIEVFLLVIFGCFIGYGVDHRDFAKRLWGDMYFNSKTYVWTFY